MSANAPKPKTLTPFTKQEFASGQDVRWCPGCGDYSILASMQRTLAKFDTPRENYVFISGIGCASRFPYYMNTYGFHTIHGRAPTIATGLRCVNPDLEIWVITGDGDGLSIGGNHLIHCMRRNVNLNIVLVNNQVYGLTKGQASPTSPMGSKTKSTPKGVISHPINPLCIAIASEATFIARTLDTNPSHMNTTLERAKRHQGTSFIEIYQNCIIFNDKTFDPVTGRDTRDDRMVCLNHGEPLIFGSKKDKAIRMNGLHPEIVKLADVQDTSELLTHDEKDPNPYYPYLLTQMTYPNMPVPFGVFRAIERPMYDQLKRAQVDEVIREEGSGDLQQLIYGKETWVVK